MTDCDCDDDMTEDGHGRACPNSITVRLAEEYARGVADERARVVAWLRAADSECLVWFAAQRIEQGWHEEKAMNDDVKAAVERFHTWEFDGLDARDHAALLAHIDGEPARIAAACEEVREAVARHVMGPALKRDPDLFADHLEEVYAATIRRMPLTATPLADALRLANETVVKLAQASTEAQASAAEGVRYWTDLAQAEARDAAALRARVAELERDSAAMTVTANAEVEAGLAIAAERDALRAQVEAARTYARQALDYGEDCDATDLLAAMDEAKP